MGDQLPWNGRAHSHSEPRVGLPACCSTDLPDWPQDSDAEPEPEPEPADATTEMTDTTEIPDGDDAEPPTEHPDA